MTDKPIIFSAAMICALLHGRKTQTRRVSGLSDVNENPNAWSLHNIGPLGYMAKPSVKGKFGATFESRKIERGTMFVCPQRLPYAVGDRLWVREAHALLPSTAYRGSIGTGTIQQRECPTDKATACVYSEGFDRSGRPYWRSSRYMHRWASRITLLVTDVHVQRLHDITEQDVLAEGLAKVSKDGRLWKFGLPDRDGLPGDDDHGWHWKDWSADPKQAFARLWNSLHGDAWGLNPWVAVYTFKPVLRNIDELEEGASDD